MQTVPEVWQSDASLFGKNDELSEHLKVAIRDGVRQVAQQARNLAQKRYKNVDNDTFSKLQETLNHALERESALERLATVTEDTKEQKKIGKLGERVVCVCVCVRVRELCSTNHHLFIFFSSLYSL